MSPLLFARSSMLVVRSSLVAMLVVASLVAPVWAQQTQAPQTTGASDSQTDRVDLIALSTRQPAPDSPPEQLRFDVTVKYQLESNDSGIMLLFVFENSSENSTQQSSSGIPISRGTGKLQLAIDYTLHPGLRSLTIVAGMFQKPQKLLAWVSTNPIDMAPWPGRVAFEKAMTARLQGDFAAAEQQLSQAITDAPDTGNYYYWRGDTRVRLSEYDGAVADFSKSLELAPNDRASRVARGVAWLWSGDPQDAVTDLSTVIASNGVPDGVTAWAYRARGLAYANLGQSEAAVADYQQYLALAPSANDRDQVAAWITQLSS